MAIFGAIMYVFLSLLVLIKIGLVNQKGAKIETFSENINLYLLQAIITIFISTGVIAGSIIGGRIADKKSRSFAVIFSFFLTSISTFLLFTPISSNGWHIVLIFATIVGISMGWNASALTSIISEYSKKYPETNLTYLSICSSFTNFGGVISLFTIGIIFNILASQTSDIILMYGIAFGSMTLIYLLGSLFTFFLMDKKQFEYKFDGKD
jgi:MFS family permease